MSFRDNLQHLRATRHMTQEQLAMLVGVSRQSVTKWESERSYPEMDKLLKICQIFDCSIDELVQGDLTARPAEPQREMPKGPATDVCGYDEFMRGFSLKIAVGVGVIILGVACSSLLEGVNPGNALADADALGSTLMLALVAVGLAFVIPATVGRSAFVKAHPYVEDFYTEEDRAQATRMLSFGLMGGIALILCGLAVFLFLFEGTRLEGLFLVCVAAGVALIVYGVLMHGRVNVDDYNDAALEELSDDEIRSMGGKDAEAKISRRRRAKRAGAVCGIIMLVATIIALLLLFMSTDPTTHRVTIPWFWLPWPIGGICCGIAWNLMEGMDARS